MSALFSSLGKGHKLSIELQLAHSAGVHRFHRVQPASIAKIAATLGVFVLPILKGRFGVPAVLGMMAAVSVPGLTVTLIFGHEDSED